MGCERVANIICVLEGGSENRDDSTVVERCRRWVTARDGNSETDEISGTCRPTEVAGPEAQQCPWANMDRQNQCRHSGTRYPTSASARRGKHRLCPPRAVRPSFRELIYEGNARREQSIGAVLDHLGGVGIGIMEPPGQSGKQTTNFSCYILTGCAEFTVRNGLKKSVTAFPSATNSGFETSLTRLLPEIAAINRRMSRLGWWISRSQASPH